MDARLRAYADTVSSACWWWPHTDFVIVSERPLAIHRDPEGRLHSTTGPAIHWPDGWGVYSVHGVRVPADIIEQPESITAARIDAEQNAEIRRVMLDLYGTGRYLRETGTQPIHRDRFGILYRREQPDDEPLCVVRVMNSTPESCGSLAEDEARDVFGGDVVDRSLATMAKLGVAVPVSRYKEYWLRVPPTMTTAHEAVAWTFGMTPAEYLPAVET